jgi:hypothetical protein
MKRLYGFLPLPLLWAPDGAGGGGAPPEEIPLDDWIRRLNEAKKEDRKAIAEELAGVLGIKTGAAFKKLIAAGWDPNNNGEPLNNSGTPPVKRETVPVTLRHKSPYPHYRRAGLLLTGRWKSYAVTAEQRAALENDAWVEIQKPGETAGFQGPAKP